MSTPIRVVVRQARPGDIDDESFERIQKTFGALEGVMAGAMAIDVVAPTVYSAGNIVIGIPIAVGLWAINAHERAVQDRLIEAVGKADLPALLQTAMARELETSAGDAPGLTRLEIVPLAYGVVEDKSRQDKTRPAPPVYCVVASILVTLHNEDKEIFRDQFIVHMNGRSANAPIPVCRFKTVLVAEKNNIVGEAFADYASALPGFLQARIPGLPWRD